MNKQWDVWFKAFFTLGFLSVIGFMLKSIVEAWNITPGPHWLLGTGAAALCTLSIYLIVRVWRADS